MAQNRGVTPNLIQQKINEVQHVLDKGGLLTKDKEYFEELVRYLTLYHALAENIHDDAFWANTSSSGKKIAGVIVEMRKVLTGVNLKDLEALKSGLAKCHELAAVERRKKQGKLNTKVESILRVVDAFNAQGELAAHDYPNMIKDVKNNFDPGFKVKKMLAEFNDEASKIASLEQKIKTQKALSDQLFAAHTANFSEHETKDPQIKAKLLPVKTLEYFYSFIEKIAFYNPELHQAMMSDDAKMLAGALKKTKELVKWIRDANKHYPGLQSWTGAMIINAREHQDASDVDLNFFKYVQQGGEKMCPGIYQSIVQSSNVLAIEKALGSFRPNPDMPFGIDDVAYLGYCAMLAADSNAASIFITWRNQHKEFLKYKQLQLDLAQLKSGKEDEDTAVNRFKHINLLKLYQQLHETLHDVSFWKESPHAVINGLTNIMGKVNFTNREAVLDCLLDCIEYTKNASKPGLFKVALDPKIKALINAMAPMLRSPNQRTDLLSLDPNEKDNAMTKKLDALKVKSIEEEAKKISMESSAGGMRPGQS